MRFLVTLRHGIEIVVKPRDKSMRDAAQLAKLADQIWFLRSGVVLLTQVTADGLCRLRTS
jgi:hypothetical protein